MEWPSLLHSASSCQKTHSGSSSHWGSLPLGTGKLYSFLCATSPRGGGSFLLFLISGLPPCLLLDFSDSPFTYVPWIQFPLSHIVMVCFPGWIPTTNPKPGVSRAVISIWGDDPCSIFVHGQFYVPDSWVTLPGPRAGIYVIIAITAWRNARGRVTVIQPSFFTVVSNPDPPKGLLTYYIYHNTSTSISSPLNILFKHKTKSEYL